MNRKQVMAVFTATISLLYPMKSLAQVGALVQGIKDGMRMNCAIKFPELESEYGLRSPYPVLSTESFSWVDFRKKYKSCLIAMPATKETCIAVEDGDESKFEKLRARKGEKKLRAEVMSLIDGPQKCIMRKSGKGYYEALSEFVR